MSSSQDYAKMFFSLENDHYNPRANRVAQMKSVLLLVATIVAILALLGLLLLSGHFSRKVNTLEGKIAETKNASEEINELLLQKTMFSLGHLLNGKSGHKIQHKLTGECLDTYHEYKSYAVYRISCNEDSTQKWQLINSQLVVGEWTRYPLIQLKPGFKPCLECDQGHLNCTLTANVCVKGTARQRFFFKVKANKLDLAQKRVFFTIHSELYPTRCAGFYSHDDEYDYEVLHLAYCTGKDDQLFYLPEVSYEKEFDKLYQRLLVG